MKVDFFKEIPENLSPMDALSAYECLAGHHLKLLKQQSNCAFFYWKLAGVFYLVCFAAFIMQNNGVISNALIGIVFVGIACIIEFIRNAKIDLGCILEEADCLRIGVDLEKKYGYFEGAVFKIFDDHKTLWYRGGLWMRLLPMEIVAVSTAVAWTFLATNVAPWVAIVVGILSTVGLIVSGFFYIKAAKKAMLGKNSCSDN